MHHPSLNDIVRPYMHLPGAIQTALIRVETHPVFRTLTKSALKVLKAVVSRASATNAAAIIRARLDRLAEEAGVSYKTAQRALRVFAERGWVQAASEGRSEYGVFESKRYLLSVELCDLVHLPTRHKPAPALAHEPEMSDGAIYADLSLRKDLREISIENRKGEPPTLPSTVDTMPAETGILATGVCKLLGIARRAGHQLADVYAVAKPHLAQSGARAGRAYRYLLAMLLNPKATDYRARAAQLAREAADRATAAATRSTAERCRYRRFVAPNGTVVRFFDGSAEIRRPDGRSGILAGEQMLVLYADVDNGTLREIVE